MNSFDAIDSLRVKYAEKLNNKVFDIIGDSIVLFGTSYQYNPEHNPEGFPVSALGVDGCLQNTLIAIIQCELDIFKAKYGESHDWEKWAQDLSSRLYDLEIV